MLATNDRFFAVHPPENGDWIQVEKSPSLKTDHHLVLRAGKDLMSATGPAASASVQMRSGLVLTFWIYPVKQITEQTHRCIITYDRAEIVSARRRAGLSVNLGEEDENESAKAERKIEPAAAAEETQARVHTPTVEKAEAGAAAPVPAALQPSVVADVEKGDDKRPSGAGDMQTAARTLLSGAAADPKQFRKWTTPLHGLTVSARCVDLDEHSRIAIVAVKNVRGEAIRVLPGYPELFVETLDDKGRAFHISPVKKLHFESTNQSSVITAGSTLYYAVVYTAPILGTKQRLRVAVGQMSAADEPVAVGLTANHE